MRFDQFYANCPVCSPTRAALMSGLYPDNAGVPGVIRTPLPDKAPNWGELRDDITLLPEAVSPLERRLALARLTLAWVRSVDRTKLRLTVDEVLAVGAAVSLTGIIGFVGLIVPHLIRLVIGPDHRMLLPASALSGALLLLAADSLARSALPPAEIPVGVITALIGGPFFLALLLRNRDQVELG